MNIKLDRQSEKYISEMIRKNRLYGSPSEVVNKAIVGFYQQEKKCGFKLGCLFCERIRELLKHLRLHDPIIKATLFECLGDFNFDYLLLLLCEGEFVFSGEVSESVFFFSL